MARSIEELRGRTSSRRTQPCCANEACHMPFRRLREGKLFRVGNRVFFWSQPSSGVEEESTVPSGRALLALRRVHTVCNPHLRQEPGSGHHSWTDQLRILRWDEKLAEHAEIHAACGVADVQQLVVHWLTTGNLDYPSRAQKSRTSDRTHRRFDLLNRRSAWT